MESNDISRARNLNVLDKIRQSEIELHDKTKDLLLDILSEMTEEHLSMLDGYKLDYVGNTISTITNDGYVCVEIEDGETLNEYTLDDFTQNQLRELVEYIFFNILK